MATPDSNRRNPGRRNFAAWLMLFMPGFMFLGLLAPAAVSVKPKAEESSSPISFHHFAPRRAIQFPVAIAQAVALETGVDTVFSGARYLADQAKRVFELDVENEPSGEQIVLNEDGVENYVAETVFDVSAVEPQLVVDLTPLWDPSVFDVIPGLIARGGASQWDDFHGTGVILRGAPAPPVVIPEPTTGALLAVGLGALALRRRNRA